MFLYNSTENKNKRVIIFSKDKLVESLSNIVYHYTGLLNGYKILRGNKILLQSALGGKSDNYGNGKMYYLSTTRQRSNTSGYRKDTTGVMRLELDGNKLNQRYKGKPIDYWGKYYRNPNNFEMEDRLLSNEPEIYPASDYIKRVDIFINPNNEDQVKYAKNILYGLSNFYANKTFVYDNANDFNRQSNNTINDALLKAVYDSGERPSTEIEYDSNKRNTLDAVRYFGYLYSLLFSNSKDRVGGYAKFLRENGLDTYIRHKNVFDYVKNGVSGGISGAIEGLSIAMHNISRKPTDESQRFVDAVSKFFRENGLKSYNDLHKFIVDNGGGNQSDYERFYEISREPIKVFTCIASDGYPRMIIPNPNRESFWNIFPDREDFINELYRIMDNNHYREGDGEMEKLYKYLQHLSKNDISVTRMLEILKKFGLSEEEMDDLLNYYKFSWQNLDYYQAYDYHLPQYYSGENYNRDKERKMIDKLFIVDKANKNKGGK